MGEAGPLDRAEAHAQAVSPADRCFDPASAFAALRLHPSDRLGVAESLEAEVVSAEDFARCQDSFDDLVRRALIPNVYMHPAVARAAELHGGRRIVIVLVWQAAGPRRTLVGAWLLAEAKGTGGFSVLDTALNRLVFAGTPVVDAGLVPDVLGKMLEAIEREPNLPRIIVASDLNADEPLLSKLREVLSRRRSRAMVVGRRRRAVLTRRADGALSTELVISARQKQESRRKSRLLAEAGIEHVALTHGSEIAEPFRAFLEIEAGGWKGTKEHKGWAIRLDPALEPFAEEMIQGLMRSGCACIDALRCGERWIAFSIWLRSGSRAFGWKMAYDETFSRFGPGRRLSELVIATFLANGKLTSFDSCNGSETSFHSAIWPERLELVDIVIDVHRGGSWSGTLFMILELSRRRARASLRAARDAVRARIRQALRRT